MKNLFYKFGVLTILSSAILYGDLDDRIDKLEKEMGEISAITPHDTLGTSFSTEQPCIKNSNWFMSFDLIYWHTKAGGSEYAYSVHDINLTSSGFPIPPVKGDTKSNPFSWDLGFQVGLGYKLSKHDNWDLNAQYTWFKTENSDSTTKPGPNAVCALTWPTQVIASMAKSHMNLKLNNIDLELGRSYFLSQNISLRPHIGLKSSWIDLNRNVLYTISDLNTNFIDLTAEQSQYLVGLDIKSEEKNTFWGLGPRFGMNSKWFLGYGIHIIGDASAAILYGNFNTSGKDFVPPSTNPEGYPDGQIISIKHKYNRFTPCAQCFLGLGWGRYVNQEKQHIGLKLGYEAQYYWRVNQIFDPEDVDTVSPSYRLQFQKQSEDVMFYGLTGEARIDF